jgi:glycosyltransferase involved in cell wall biosynthesis
MPPSVSLIIPCFNEARTIGGLLEAIVGQTSPLDAMEVVVADGMSDDGTREAVQRFGAQHPEISIRVVDNPKRIIPAALNRAIEASSGQTVIRLDAHSVPRPDYVQRCLEALDRTGAANVGGIWEIQPSGDTCMARAIAAAAAHPLGAGDARYRYSLDAGEVDTVPFGAFRREWLEKVGSFNESLLTNEDYEYNVRIKQAGGKIWYDPAIRSVYFARGNLALLARQYARYGYWKSRMLLRYPFTLRWRQALPPAFAALLLFLLVGSLFWRPALWLLTVQVGAYAVISGAAGIIEGLRRRDPCVALGFLPALLMMHLGWGFAFLWGLVASIGHLKDEPGGSPGALR